ncbi:MAG: nuclear transport factor 2 family protein [Steroidobacteraceae bacterium]
MGLAENKQIAQAFYAAANRGDMEGCLDLLASDVTWTNIGSTKFSGTYVGKDDLIARLLEPVFGQLKAGITSTIDSMIAEADVVVIQLRGKAETKNGRPYNNTYCHVIRMRNGKIGEVTEYFDTELTSSVFGR